MTIRTMTVQMAGVKASNVWELMVVASTYDANGSYDNARLNAILALKRMAETVTPYGVFGGRDAFRGVESVFGKVNTVNIKTLIFGASTVDCVHHGVQRGDFGHLLPQSMGGILRLEHLTPAGVWTECLTMLPHHNANNLRVVNCYLQCSVCNRALGNTLPYEVQYYLSKMPIKLDGKLYEAVKLT